mgnify:CR=1 FL=1
MSSFIRSIERQVVPSQKVHRLSRRRGGFRLYANPPRQVFFNGRGSQLGVKNPNDACLIARQRRDKKWGRSK